MNRALQIIVGTAALAVIAVCLALNARFRVVRAHEYRQRHVAHTYAGVEYTVRLAETTVGKIASGYVVIVTIQLENPADKDLALPRASFILVDQNKEYYLPAPSEKQTETITVPAHGRRDEELLTFNVRPDALGGGLGLQVGHQYWVMLKKNKPFTGELPLDRFRSFQSVDW